VASASKGRGLFRRRPHPPQTFSVSSPGRGEGPWALTSSAARLDVADKREAKVQRMLRQGWQSDAWSYRDQIGELRYAVQFLANCTARMRLYPACYPLGGEADAPVKLEDLEGVPPALSAYAAQAMADLGNGRMAISGMLHGASSNKSIAGEYYLLGRTDPQTGEQRFSIRSVDELVVYNDQWHLREIPDDRQNGVIPWQPLDAELTVISRIWTPHPRFQLMADSPLRAMLDDCESLMILRRMIRATGRSRLASRGLLLVPEELSLNVPLEDNDDEQAEPFMAALTSAMMAPIVSEGTADGVVPIVIRGPAAELDKLRLVDLATKFDDQASKTREELIGIIATSFDLPKEIISGIADLNHWSAWQVDDNTFRHHVEPHVIGVCDDLSGAYLRPYLLANGIPAEWVARMVFWYDPVELVSHPDKTADAQQLHDRLVISDKALRDSAGFTETEAPTKAEIQVRMLEKMRMWPPNLVMAFLHQWDPTIIAPPITVSGTVPGIKPGGVDTGTDPGESGAPIVPGRPSPAGGTPSASTPATPAPGVADKPGPPPAERPLPTPITAGAQGQASTGVMIALYPDPTLATKLALAGGEPPDELHITLAFLGDESDLKDPAGLQAAVQAWAKTTPALAGEISGPGLFTAGPDPVTYLSIDLPSLPDARQRLVDALAAAGAEPSQEHGFTPHMTLDYTDRLSEVSADLGGTAVTFASVACVVGAQRTDYPLTGDPTPITAAASKRATTARLSRKLATIDQTLRARLQTAANAAVLRQLERAGARLRTKVAKDETLRTKIAHRANERVPALLGRDVVTAAGLSPAELVGSDWSGLRAQFYDWTAAAQGQALQTALRIGQLDADSDAAARAQAAMASGRDGAWDLLSQALSSLGQHLLYNPDPNAGPGDWADLNPDTLVPAGTIRAALGVAGGASAATLTPDVAGAVTFTDAVGQIGTGSTIAELITAGGGQREGYEWVYGPALNGFPPHEDLDGVQFESFDDDALANPGDFPANQYFLPGDHDGCVCDFMPIYLGPDESDG